MKQTLKATAALMPIIAAVVIDNPDKNKKHADTKRNHNYNNTVFRVVRSIPRLALRRRILENNTPRQV